MMKHRAWGRRLNAEEEGIGQKTECGRRGHRAESMEHSVETEDGR
jgi:hypothetical protein